MYLVIDSMNKYGDKFTSFIDLNKLYVQIELQEFINHLELFEDKVILKVRFANKKLSNW